jgi:ketosteroid isomerase-like protein
MKTLMAVVFCLLVFCACNTKADKQAIKKEIFKTEKDFEKMAAEKGVAEAFYYFADDSAVILRQNDSIIKGKENIKAFYAKREKKNVTVNWTPDFLEVSDCGTLGYTYGKYVWKITDDSAKVTEYKGVFHTVWKKQKDGTWKYVWD